MVLLLALRRCTEHCSVCPEAPCVSVDFSLVLLVFVGFFSGGCFFLFPILFFFGTLSC